MNEAAANLVANAGIHFAILLAFWLLLYKLIAYKIAREAFRDQIKGPTLSLANAVEQRYPSLKSLKSAEYANQHQALSSSGQARNDASMRDILYAIAAVVVLLFFLPRITKQTIHWGHLLKENAVTYLFVGIVEYWYFMNIARLYVPTKPSQMQKDLFGQVKKRAGC